jgi:hypothetical protein
VPNRKNIVKYLKAILLSYTLVNRVKIQYSFNYNAAVHLMRQYNRQVMNCLSIYERLGYTGYFKLPDPHAFEFLIA